MTGYLLYFERKVGLSFCLLNFLCVISLYVLHMLSYCWYLLFDLITNVPKFIQWWLWQWLCNIVSAWDITYQDHLFVYILLILYRFGKICRYMYISFLIEMAILKEKENEESTNEVFRDYSWLAASCMSASTSLR